MNNFFKKVLLTLIALLAIFLSAPAVLASDAAAVTALSGIEIACVLEHNDYGSYIEDRITLLPSADDYAAIYARSENGVLNLTHENYGGLKEVSLDISLNTLLALEGLKGVRFQASYYASEIPVEVLLKYDDSGVETLRFVHSHLDYVTIQPIDRSGNIINCIDYRYPILFEMQYSPYEGERHFSVGIFKMGQNEADLIGIPRSYYGGDGMVYGKSYSAGVYGLLGFSGLNGDYNDTNALPVDEAAKYLTARRVIHGVAQGYFAPDRNATRAEFVTLLMRMLQYYPADAKAAEFLDYGSLPEWSVDEINAAYRLRIVTGKSYGGVGCYFAEAPITREEMYAIAYRALSEFNMIDEAQNEIDFEDGGDISDYALQAVAALTEAGLVKAENGVLKPKSIVKRAEAAQFIYEILLYDR